MKVTSGGVAAGSLLGPVNKSKHNQSNMEYRPKVLTCLVVFGDMPEDVTRQTWLT